MVRTADPTKTVAFEETGRAYPERATVHRRGVHGRGALNVKSLLIFFPISLGLDWWGADPIVVFLASALAIVPLSHLIGEATENLAAHLGQTWGGLLNATMGNLPEMVISVFTLRRGLPTIVKASLSGSLLGNVLLN